MDEKTGDYVRDILKSKHPEARDVSLVDILFFDKYPKFTDILVTKEIVELVAK